MPDKVRMKVTIEAYYDADPKYYGEHIKPHDMAMIDMQGDVIELITNCIDEDNNDFLFKIEPV
jgi:hypothetical protein